MKGKWKEEVGKKGIENGNGNVERRAGYSKVFIKPVLVIFYILMLHAHYTE